MKLLVTGGCGFIGSAVCRHASQELGWSVVNVDVMTYASSYGSTKPLHSSDNYIHEKVDITDQKLMDRIFAEYQPDGVIHLAAESHVDRSIDGPMVFINTNIIGTATLLEAVKSYLATTCKKRASDFRFLHVSTDEVFGSLELDEASFTEDTPYDPSSPYSASKAASDHIVRSYGRTYSLPVLLTNCSNNYGSFHFPEKLIPLMIIKAIQREALPVYGNGSNIRDWLFVDDHARALCLVIQNGKIGESYNIGGNAERTNLDVVKAICDIVDDRLKDSDSARRDLIRFVADRPGHDLRYAIDASKIRNELGWQPSLDFEEGLSQTIDWYLANREWWQEILFRDKHVGSRLGSLAVQVAAI